MKFISLIFKIILFTTLFNSNVYSFEDKNNIKIRPLKTTPFGEYNFDKLEKIKIPMDFPTHRAIGWENCKTSKRETWSSNITFYLSKDFAWGIRSSSNSIKVYMTQKIKNNLNFRVYEASKKWKTKKDWISGYKINQANNLNLSLKKEIKGKYVSKGGDYWRSCTIKFDSVDEAKDTLTKSDWLTIIKRNQLMALHRLNLFGLKVTQKYDFESISDKFDKMLSEEVKAAKLADKKAKKLAEEKAKRDAELKAKKLAKEKAKRDAELKAKKLAEEAKLIAKIKEEDIEKNLKWFKMRSEGLKRIKKADNYIFNFQNSQNKELFILYNKIDKYLKLSIKEISNEEIINLKNILKTYNKLFTNIHKENLKSGAYGKFDYRNVSIELRNNLENEFSDINKKLKQFIEILNSYFNAYIDLKNKTNTDLKNFMKSKFDEKEYNYFNKIISKEKINELEKIDRKNDKIFYESFFWKAAYHVSFGKEVDLAIKEWLESYQGNYVSYYNKKIYDMSINKNIKDIENKQKNEEDFFNKIGN